MRVDLSHRELQIIEALGKGKSAKQIAEKGADKEETVRDHIEALQAKLGAASQADIPERFTNLTGWANPPTDYK